ncbi:MAG TPA: NAD-dependent epimerase/dehydratase family protein [Acetobacteraceae bacterium]|nr:NAD-dependent epimerase/dehydratase family protein [Acetobacteraceae bacterium]
MTRVALIGAGYISRVHAEAIRLIPGINLAAVIDPMPGNAQALAREHHVPLIFHSVQEALAADAFDRAHVLVPPDQHAAVAQALLAAGKPALVEKPLAASHSACEELAEQAAAQGVTLGVNQNFVHHPAFRKLRDFIGQRGLGRPNHIACIYNMPLRQLSARQFRHWMFAAPGNLLLEQAVHPLSQIAALAGEISDIRVLRGTPFSAGSQTIYPSFDAILGGARLTASLRFAVGQAYPLWQLSVVCDDGMAVADMLGNRFYTVTRTRWLEVVDNIASAARTAGAMVGASLLNGCDYGLSMLRLKKRNDPFLQSMVGSIREFHAAVDAGHPPQLDARFGAMLVETCERIADQGFEPVRPPVRSPAAPRLAEAPAARQPAAIAILGGTGFIGTHLVQRCLTESIPVSILARSTQALPEFFDDPLVTLHAGSITDPAAVDAAIEGVSMVVNLAHGGGSGSREQITAAMVGGAEVVARACLRHGVSRLVHVGSIASLYLGPQPQPVTGGTPPDPLHEQRADYARAKALCDRMLLDMHARLGLPVVILRPGLVVGEGGIALHSGLGFFNNDQHCLGWNGGRNPLPFVLAEDVADAILRACRAEGVAGRCYNLVGDVRPDARAYIAALGAAMQRPLKFHPQAPLGLFASELGKWAIKRAGGRNPALPSRRDILSRGLSATFDCSDAKRDLGWLPVSDPAAFHDRAIRVHAS